MKQWIGSASSVEEAVTEGIKSLGLSRDQVDVEVLEEQSSNLFSMIGYRRVRVKVSERPEGAPPRRPQRPEGRRDERGRPPQQQQQGRPQGGRDESRGRGNREGGRRDEGRRTEGGGRDEGNRPGGEQQGAERSWRGRDDRYDYGPGTERPQQDQRRDDRGGRRDNRGNQQSNRPPQERRLGGGGAPSIQGRPDQGQGRQDQNRQDSGRQDQGRRPFRDRGDGRRNDDRRRDQGGRPPFREPRPEGAQAGGGETAPQQRPPLPDRPLRADLPQNLEGHLALWKQWLGWDDLEWTIETPDSDSVTVSLKTSHKDKLFGPSGDALEAFEHLFNTVVGRAIKDRPRAQFQLEGFSDPKRQRIIDDANQAAEEVKRSGRMFRLDPMGSTDRRLVHQTLANHPDVETFSEGEGPWRKVVIRPKKKN